MNKINQLEQRKMENNEEKKRLTEQKDALTEEIRDVKQSKQSEIAKLKKSIEEMSSEFASMLKDTLNKMKMKIEAANDKWETENDGQMLKRFEEVSNPKV